MLNSSMSKTKKLTYFAILTALVVVLQFTANAVKIGAVTLNFVLVPLIVCGMVLGAAYAIALGAIIGVIILLSGVIGMDGFTNVLFGEAPVVITLVCVLKTALAGLAGALIFKFFYKRHKLLGTFLSAAATPIVNTGVFVLGMLTITSSLVSNGYIDGGKQALVAICVGLVGVNFVFELILNLVLAPAVYRVIEILEKSFNKDAETEVSNAYASEASDGKNKYDKTNDLTDSTENDK